MVTIYGVRMDFLTGNMGFARELYGRWDSFCRIGVEEVLEEVFSRYDSPDEVIQVGRLEVDLAVVAEEEFYESFPKRLKTRLEDAFHDLLRHAGANEVHIVSLNKDGLEVLISFLRYGRFPETIPEEYRDLRRLLEVVVERDGRELGRELRRYGDSVEVRRRLVRQFKDKELEKVVEVTDLSESLFIKVYTRSLLVSWHRLRQPEITFGDYRNVVWEVVWAYLLCEGRNFFSRKQLVRQTIAELALRFNLKFLYLLGLLTAGLKKMISGWLILPELSVILSEIRCEEAEKNGRESDGWRSIPTGEEGNRQEEWRRLLSHPESCRRLLLPMPEEEIYHLVEIIVPDGSPFIISYARKLQQDQKKGMLEGKAGNEFRILKWEFLFSVLLEAPASAFRRKRYVLAVLCRIAAHYNVDPRTLLAYLCMDRKSVPVELQQVLQELYQEHLEHGVAEMIAALDYREMTGEESGRVRFVLLHPRMGRRLLSMLPEERIYRLTRALLPVESPFIISYARTLDREQEKGMLEGKGGSGFRVLKWEFIFLIVLSAPESVFHRKQFVRSVLVQIAAHYNFQPADLAVYFFRALSDRKEEFAVSVREVLGEWLQEWRVETAGVSSGSWHRMLEEWMALPAMTAELLESSGMERVERLLLGYQQEKVAGFIREHRAVLWEFMVSSTENVRKLYHRLQTVEGLGDFLIRVWGRQALYAVFQRAGIWLPDTDKLCTMAWQEALIRKDAAMIADLLAYSRDFLRSRVVLMTGEEKERLERVLQENPELLRKWLTGMGTAALRQAVEEVLCLQEKAIPGMNIVECLMKLLNFTYGGLPDYSRMEILSRYGARLAEELPLAGQIEVFRQARRQRLAVWEEIWRENRSMEEAVRFVIQEENKMENKEVERTGMKEQERGVVPEKEKVAGETNALQVVKEEWKPELPKREEKTVYINNAGIVILAPYFPRLFELLKLTDKGVFADDKARVRAMFAMQYLGFGQTEFAETELALNKLLVGYSSGEPLPLAVELASGEKEILDSLLAGAMGNWKVMQHTSVDGFRGSFLIREGVLAETGELWQLTVEEKAYDILLDSLPWTISPVKLAGMTKPLYVNWR